MLDALPHIQLHLLDSMPAHVVAKVTGGLQSRGHYAVIRCAGHATNEDPIRARPLLERFATRLAGPHVLLTSRPLVGPEGDPVVADANPERAVSVVCLPVEPGESRFDPVVAQRVLDLVLEQLALLQARTTGRAAG